MFELKQIGIIRTPFKKAEGMPIQAPFAKGIKGEIMIFDEYKIGWLEQNIEKAAYLQSDNRFISNDKGNKNE